MSLRAFHLLFIALSIVLATYFAAWSAGQYRADGNIGYLGAAVGALAAGGFLAGYGAVFQRKTRKM